MKILEVSINDCKHCAKVINALQNAQFPVTAKELPEYQAGIKWLHDVALEMAKQIKDTQTTKPEGHDGKGDNMGLPPSVQVRNYNPGDLSSLSKPKLAAKKSKKKAK